jgi:hypothetical protein
MYPLVLCDLTHGSVARRDMQAVGGCQDSQGVRGAVLDANWEHTLA